MTTSKALQNPHLVYHICHATDWQENAESYSAESLTVEGFIHFSSATQVLATAKRYYENERDLILLEVNANKLKAQLIYEDSLGLGEKFPHLYGELNTDAVTRIMNLIKNEAGDFTTDGGLQT